MALVLGFSTALYQPLEDGLSDDEVSAVQGYLYSEYRAHRWRLAVKKLYHTDDDKMRVKFARNSRVVSVSVIGSRRPNKSAPPGNKSLSRLSYRSRRAMTERALGSDFKWRRFITLTFGDYYPTAGEARLIWRRFAAHRRVKAALGKFMRVLEFQARGAPHYHILASVSPNNEEIEFCLRWWVQCYSDWANLQLLPTPPVDLYDKAIAFHLHREPLTGEYSQWQIARDAGRYIAKYFSKGVCVGSLLAAGVRRWWSSSRALCRFDVVTVTTRALASAVALARACLISSNAANVQKHYWLFDPQWGLDGLAPISGSRLWGLSASYLLDALESCGFLLPNFKKTTRTGVDLSRV